jgi:hypothetical protein
MAAGRRIVLKCQLLSQKILDVRRGRDVFNGRRVTAVARVR